MDSPLIDLNMNRVGGLKFANTCIPLVFPRQQYMVGPERLYLASRLNLTEAQVSWFVFVFVFVYKYKRLPGSTEAQVGILTEFRLEVAIGHSSVLVLSLWKFKLASSQRHLAKRSLPLTHSMNFWRISEQHLTPPLHPPLTRFGKISFKPFVIM